eukprot:13545028-Ditylum_brightwellii.AAC.1
MANANTLPLRKEDTTDIDLVIIEKYTTVIYLEKVAADESNIQTKLRHQTLAACQPDWSPGL